MGILRIGNKLLAWGSNILKMPDSLFTYIQSAFSNGFIRNMALSTIGGHDNALMGSYLLATTNNSITIAGFLATDVVWDLTTGTEMLNITKTNGLITLQNTYKYGAFEVRRVGATIGRYCLTERLGTILINQFRGAGFLPHGTLNGTITNCWQRSNTYYAETNKTGYSVAGAGWYADATGTQALTQYSFIPADLANPTKCLAWVGGVQQDLQFIGYARNNISLIPYSFYCNVDRRWQVAPYSGTSLTHAMKFYGVVPASTVARQLFGTIDITTFDGARTLFLRGNILYLYYKEISLYDTLYHLGVPVIITGGWDGYKFYLKQEYPLTGIVYIKNSTAESTPTQLTITSRATAIGSSGASSKNLFNGYIACVQELVNDVLIHNYIPNQHSPSFIDTTTKSVYTPNGAITNLYQNINCVVFPHIQQGYELWTSGTDYQMYPLADDDTRIITPAGYNLVETVAAGNVPSVADSRLSTVKYSLANSNDLYKVVPEAFNTDATVTPKVLSYNELSALTSNIKVTKTEANGKITNLTIRQ